MRFSPPAGMNLYAYTRDSRERETERDKVTQGEKRDICGFPLQGPRRPARFFIRYSGALMLLLLPPLTPTATPSDTSGDRHSQITWIAIVSRSSKRNHLKNLWCSLCFISSALTQKAIMMSELAEARPSRPEDIFVSCCLGQFNWEANLLPLLLIHTHRVLWNKWCLTAKCNKSSLRPDNARFHSNYGCCCSHYDRLQRKYLNEQTRC